MTQIKEGSLLWKPTEKLQKQSNIKKYMDWLHTHRNKTFSNYQTLWEWSVHDIEGFWESIWDYFQIKSITPYNNVLSQHEMPGAKWFQGATINYTEHVFRDFKENEIAIIHASEGRELTEITWGELYKQTKSFQQTLKNLGVKKGDRVVAYVANLYETIVAFLATASLGAIWSSASPDFGTESVIDRFKQIKPKIMITVDGYLYNGKKFDRTEIVANIQSELDSLEATIVIPYLNENPHSDKFVQPILYEDAIKTVPHSELTYEYVEFNEPLWVLFSSGTTGKPKPIVHSQGGILLEHLKALYMHFDLKENERFFWYTTTGWMMWNFLVGGLLVKSTIILYDGSPMYPNKNTMWKFVVDTKMNIFGTSASYIVECMKSNLSPKNDYNLAHLKCISSTGSPLPPEGFQWIYDHVNKNTWIASMSGGTDVCTAFILGAPILPVYAGELQCRGLGAKIESFTEDGTPIVDEVGELVLTAPLPSMPIYFWNDDDGSRMHDSYFDMFPSIWRHGDYLKITDRHTCIIYGRSDATINRGGIRIGTSEIYRAVDQVDEIKNSLIVDVPNKKDTDSTVILFVTLKKGNHLTDEIKGNIKQRIREQCSPRHVPTEIHEVSDLPVTLNGKKLEVPVKRILMGRQVDEVVNKGSLSNPESIDYFVQFAKTLDK